jgi:RNA polymerase sigma-70 factor (ECF subfamily)
MTLGVTLGWNFGKIKKVLDNSPNQSALSIAVDTYDSSQITLKLRHSAERLAREGIIALEEIYDLAGLRLVRYAYTLTRHHDDAEDAFQAAMVRLARYPLALRRAENPWAYVLRMVRNEALRLTQKRVGTSALPVTEVGTEESPPLDEFEMQRAIRLAVEKLPPNQSEVVVLKIWEGMTFLEIAEVLGESPNTVASRYRYALEKLTRILQSLSSEVSRDV